MVKKSRKIYFLGSAIIALASLFLVYFLLIVTGVVQVKNEIITITSGSIEATYNGEPVMCEEVEVTQGELRKGHTIEAIYTGKVVNVGSAANTYTFRILDSENIIYYNNEGYLMIYLMSDAMIYKSGFILIDCKTNKYKSSEELINCIREGVVF